MTEGVEVSSVEVPFLERGKTGHWVMFMAVVSSSHILDYIANHIRCS